MSWDLYWLPSTQPEGDADDDLGTPGKVTLTQRLHARAPQPESEASAAPVQADGAVTLDDPFAVHLIAQRGVGGPGTALPHADAIQASFGHHDVSGVRAHVGGGAAEAATAIGARAYATGDDVAFGAAPDLRQAAHEAAHVVQQRGGVRLDGGVGRAGDPYEQHADAVADRVVRGEDAEALLDTMAHRGAGGGPAVQREDRDHDGIEDTAIPAPGAIAEALTAIETLINGSTLDQLSATTTALPARLRSRPAAGVVYQVPIAGAVHHVAAADLAAVFQLATARARITGDAAELRQDWGRYDLHDAPLSPADPSAIRAVATNADLGLHGSVIRALWTTLLADSIAHPFFTRTLTDAMRARGVPGGVLDAPSIHALALGEALAAFDARHLHPAALDGLSAAQLATLTSALGAPATAVTRTETTPHRGAPRVAITVTRTLVVAAAEWQAWHLRGTERAPNGHLTADDLAALGVTAAAPAAEGAAADGAPAEGAAPAAAARVTEAQRARIAAWHEALTRLLQQYEDSPPPIVAEPGGPRITGAERTRRNRDWRVAHRAEVDAALTTRLDGEVLPAMEHLGVADWSPAQNLRGSDTVMAWGRRVDGRLAELIGASGSHDADVAATAALGDYVVGASDLRRSGWDPRLTHDGVVPQDQSPLTLAALGAYRGLVTRLRALTEPALAAAPPRASAEVLAAARPGLVGALTAIAGHLHLPPPAARITTTEAAAADGARRLAPPPDLIRNSISAHWPSDPTPGAESIATLRTQVQAWDAVLRGLLGHARGSSIEAAASATTHYGHDIVNVNPDAVYVDLHRSGVEVTNNRGNALTPDETATRREGDSDGDNSIHLDPEFALAMVHFLEALAGMGVTRMWTSGFLRGAMSYADTHPMGMACDVTGFTFSDGTVIHLRSGYPPRRRGGAAAAPAPAPVPDAAPEATDDAAPAPAPAPVSAPELDATDTAHGHSDWFDFEHTFAGRPHAHVMMGIAAMMPRYFHRIIGPGHNDAHMAHFHVELSPSGAPRNGLRLHAVSSESTHLPDWTRDGADRHDPTWDDHVLPIPLTAPPAPAADDGTPEPEPSE